MTLSESLRARSDEELLALLRHRPDLAAPAPGDMGTLASRASVRLSVARALEQLDAGMLSVLDALVVLGPGAVARDDLTALLGGDVETDLGTALDRLRELALVWGDDAGLHLVGTVAQLIPYPAGLGRPATELRIAPPDVATLVLDLDESEREVLDRLAAGPPIGAAQLRADSPVARLIWRGLLARLDAATVELPREVGLFLRGDRPLGDLPGGPPALVGAALDPASVDATGSGQVLATIRLLAELLNTCALDPPAELRAGGIGVRDLRRLARRLDVEPPVAALLLEVASASGLLDLTGEPARAWLPTPGYDNWLALLPERRWTQVAAAWLGMARQPGLVGQRDERDRVLAPLSIDVARSGAPEARRRVLQALADLPPGTAPDRPALVAWLAWQAPRRGGRLRDEVAGWALTEAEILGMTGRGAMTTYGAALLVGSDAASALSARLPEPLDHVLLQADLTAVAPGPLEPKLARDLALIADVESSGGATVYRITPASVRRALDVGRTAGELHEMFRLRSRTPVPQALTYLIDDMARRHGGLRVGEAKSYLRSEDASLLSEVVGDRSLQRLKLRRLAPTVVVSPLRPADLLDALRATGYAPARESSDGAVLVGAAEPRRAAHRGRAARTIPVPPRPSDEQLADVVSHLRVHDRASRAARQSPATTTALAGVTTASTLAMLQQAARDRHRIWLSYVDSAGNEAARVVQPLSVGGGFLRATDDRADTMHTFALHRITSVTRVEG